MKERRKIYEIEALKGIVRELQSKGKKVVFTNGCFDLIHLGHVRFLKKAREKGDYLVLAVNSDDSVRSLKGKDRPILGANERKRILSAFECVDFVVEFNDLTPEKIIRDIEPDVLVKGGDYSVDQIVGRNFVEAHGGKVETIELVDGYSTSALIDKICRLEGEV